MEGRLVRLAFESLCSSLATQSLLCPLLASTFLTLIDGSDVNYLRSPVYVTSQAYAVSSKQLAHFLQIARTNSPAPLDTRSPVTQEQQIALPAARDGGMYDASRITCDSIALITSAEDVFADPKDVSKLRGLLGRRPVFDQEIREEGFGHASMLFGESALVSRFVNQPILRILDSFYPHPLAIYAD